MIWRVNKTHRIWTCLGLSRFCPGSSSLHTVWTATSLVTKMFLDGWEPCSTLPQRQRSLVVSFTWCPSTFVTINKHNNICVGHLPRNLPTWHPFLHSHHLLNCLNCRCCYYLLVSDNNAKVFVSFPYFRLLGVLASIHQLHHWNQ